MAHAASENGFTEEEDQFMLAAIKPFGDLFSICGALLIFFSWLVTSTLGDRFKAAKAAYETAGDKRRLYRTLDTIVQGIEGVSADVARAFIDTDRRLGALLDPRRDEHAPRDADEQKELVIELASAELTASQIDHGCRSLLEQLDADPRSSPAQKLLSESRTSLDNFLDEKNALFKKMHENVSRLSGGALLEDVRQEQDKLYHTWQAMVQSFVPLMEVATEAVDARENELGKDYRKARDRSARASQTSLYLYIIGTALVLSGTVLDKLVK
jgi:hypothetical protein